jgi:hypothetical protein
VAEEPAGAAPTVGGSGAAEGAGQGLDHWDVEAVPERASFAVRPRRLTWLRHWLGTADGRAVMVLVGVPLVVFLVPDLLGHPAIAADNLIQNFPLRVLVGDMLRQGHLPLWNPYIWSGSPLLGGLNAGAAYPLTALFGILPAVAAWTLNMMAVYWAAGLGMYALLRQYRLQPVACLLAGLTYAFGGAMTGQMVHLGLVQGMGWMPWMLLALLRLSWAVLGTAPAAPSDAPAGDGPDSDAPAGDARPPGSPWPWVVLLAVTIAMVVLTGEPRSMAEAEVVAGFVVLWLALRPYGSPVVGAVRRVRFLALSVVAGLWGVLISAAQILPGWDFITASQRASENYTFFGAGSLRPSWTVLMLVPDLFGGSGILRQPAYFNSYNLPEVTGYVGLLPLVALVALALRSFGKGRDPRSSNWGMWLALAVFGLLLTWGEFTPLGHLFVHIPLFGKTRLQSRNLGVVDLALAGLLGFWADRALRRRADEAPEPARRRWVALAPALAAGALCIVGIAIPYTLELHYGAYPPLGRRLTPWFLAELVVVAAVVAVVLGLARMDRRRRARWLSAVVALDLVFFMASSATGLNTGYAQAEPSTAQAAAVLGTHGRFAIFDTTDADLDLLSTVGQPDLNAFTQLPSVQGYGSIVADTYATATGTHTLDDLDACALAKGDFAQLRLATILSLPSYLAPGLGAQGQIPAPPPPCPGAPAPGSAHRRTFYFGWTVPVVSVALARVPGAAVEDQPLRLGILEASGAVAWPPEAVRRSAGGGWSVRFDRPAAAVGLVVAGPARAVSDTSTFSDGMGEGWALDGALQDAMSTPGWRFTGLWQIYARFTQRTVRPPVWLTGTASGGRVRQVSTDQWGTEVDQVTTTRPVTLVRSEAYAPGWHAELVPVGGGPGETVDVEAAGLVQAVRVPPGEWDVTFLYRPRTLNLGLAGSTLGLAALALSGAWAYLRRRRPIAAR